MEHGPELVQMPSGSKVYTNRETNSMMRQESTQSKAKEVTSNNVSVNVNINGLTVREEADIDRITTAIVKKIKQNMVVYGG